MLMDLSASREHKIKLVPRVRYILDIDTGVLLNMDDGKYFGLNRIGGEICESLVQGATLSEIVENICAKYDLTPEQAEHDASAFLVSLLDKGLARIQSGE